MMYTLVGPFSNSFDEKGLVYFVPDFLKSDIKIGQIVEIPFKKEIILGIVLDINIKIKEIGLENIKPIISIFNENIFINKFQIELILYISKNYFSLIHNVISLFFPKNLREKIQKQKLVFNEKKDFEYKFLKNNKLTKKQIDISEYIKKGSENKFLLFGITGSGKTEIYIDLINYYLNKKQQVLLLIPEIILNNQIHSRLSNIFGENILVINSSISEAQKTKNWLTIYNLNAKIIIGTRSALFYPYNNLGLIIVDEEHDNSYISDSSPRYNLINLVEKMSSIYSIKILLASGTPSFNSMYKALKGDYKLLNLIEKYSP